MFSIIDNDLTFLIDLLMGPYLVLPLQIEMNLGVMAMNGCIILQSSKTGASLFGGINVPSSTLIGNFLPVAQSETVSLETLELFSYL